MYGLNLHNGSQQRLIYTAMKKRNILQSFICLLAVSCTVQELDVVTPQISDGHEVFHASFESSEPDTRVSLD